MWAITPNGIGKPVGARRINPDWDLGEGETFKVEDWSEDLVLADDGVSLRAKTADEAATEASEGDAKRVTDAKTDVANFADEMAEKITGPVPMNEKLAWIKKEEAARAHVAGTPTAAQTALLQGELALTSALDSDIDTLAAKIIANADFYSVAVAAIAGIRRNTMAAIDALGPAPTDEQLDGVILSAKTIAEAKFIEVLASAPQ